MMPKWWSFTEGFMWGFVSVGKYFLSCGLIPPGSLNWWACIGYSHSFSCYMARSEIPLAGMGAHSHSNPVRLFFIFCSVKQTCVQREGSCLFTDLLTQWCLLSDAARLGCACRRSQAGARAPLLFLHRERKDFLECLALQPACGLSLLNTKLCALTVQDYVTEMSSDHRTQKAPELLTPWHPSGKKEPTPSPLLLWRFSLDCNGFDTRVIWTNREATGAHFSGCGPDGHKYEKWAYSTSCDSRLQHLKAFVRQRFTFYNSFVTLHERTWTWD